MWDLVKTQVKFSRSGAGLKTLHFSSQGLPTLLAQGCTSVICVNHVGSSEHSADGVIHTAMSRRQWGPMAEVSESVIQTHLLCSATITVRLLVLIIHFWQQTHTAPFGQNCWTRDVLSFLSVISAVVKLSTCGLVGQNIYVPTDTCVKRCREFISCFCL